MNKAYIKSYIKFFIILSCFFITLPYANGEKWVKVATIGKRTPVLDKTKGNQWMVNRMIGFWKRELSNVLLDKPDLIVLQENSDFPWGLTQAEKNAYVDVRKNQIQDFFSSVAKDNSCYILYGTRRIDEKGIIRNSGVLINRQGGVEGIYDKNYLTIGEMEAGIKPSNNVPLFKCDFGNLAVAICYDLNFEEHMSRYVRLKPDIIVFPSAYHGGFVQSVWAYTCRSYFVGAVSSVGRNSEILNPLGDIVASSTNYQNYAVSNINLDYKLVHLDYNRPKLKNLKKKYGPKVNILDPGGLGVVMITSEHEQIKVDQMVKEFDIEVLDDYFERSKKYRKTKL